MLTLVSTLGALALAIAQAAPIPIPNVVKSLETGKPTQLSPAEPKAWVVVFLSSHCPCSASHEPVLRELSQRFGADQGFRWVGVHANADETEADAAAHFKSVKLPFTVARDAGARWADALGAVKTPHAFVLSPSGEVLFSGGVDDSASAPLAKKHFLADALGAVSRGEAPPLKLARALGCRIQRP